MATLKDIRRRIASVKNTQKITRAMKLVSAAKFARANSSLVSARPYGKAFDQMVAKLIAATSGEVDSVLMNALPEENSLLIIIGTDRGFCGSLNANLFRHALFFVKRKKDEGVSVDFYPWGKRAVLATKKLSHKVVNQKEKVLDKPNYDLAKELAEDLTEQFSSGKYQRVYLGYMEFQSALSQNPVFKQLLPVAPPEPTADDADAAANLLTEPDPKALLNSLLEKKIASQIFRTMLEASASEHGARMTAMDSATSNADEVIRKLTIEANRARQAAITKELIEITTGAQAL